MGIQLIVVYIIDGWFTCFFFKFCMILDIFGSIIIHELGIVLSTNQYFMQMTTDFEHCLCIIYKSLEFQWIPGFVWYGIPQNPMAIICSPLPFWVYHGISHWQSQVSWWCASWDHRDKSRDRFWHYNNTGRPWSGRTLICSMLTGQHVEHFIQTFWCPQWCFLVYEPHWLYLSYTINTINHRIHLYS